MQPGLPRAVPMGIAGFLLGAALVILLRALQSMDPVWDAQLGLVMGGLIAAVFFLWGIGAFNPRLSEHHIEAPEEFEIIPADQAAALHPHDDEPASPILTLSREMWQVVFWVIVAVVAFFGFATLPDGFALRVTRDPLASATDIGFFTLALGDTSLVVSEFVMFILVVVVLLALLGLIAGGIGWMFYTLSLQVAQAKATPSLATLPAGSVPASAVAPERTTLQRAGRLALELLVAALLFIVFFFVAIGLVLPEPRWLLTLLSLVNAVLFTAILFHPRFVGKIVGGGARWAARKLRGLPAGLGQK